MKILNLYAGIGGNRKLWGAGHDITAIEFNPTIAATYQDLYPNDKVVVGDAHQYLLDHYHEFDFIWSSPPCQSHSRVRYIVAQSDYVLKNVHPIYPDMKLWQEIIFLSSYAKCDWVVENVIPFYKPLIQPKFTIQRHHFWSNKFILGNYFECDRIQSSNTFKEKNYGINLKKYTFQGIEKRQVLRNCVKPELGLYVFQQITGEK